MPMLYLMPFLLGICSGCDLLTADNTHKSFWPPCWIEYFSYILIFIICNLANATGIGGGGMLVPLLILLMRFQAHEAIPLSKSIILGGAIVSVAMSLLSKSPLIEFKIISILQPMILLGTAVGVTLNQIFPDTLILFLLSATLSYVIYKNITKAFSLYKAETRQFMLEAKRKDEDLEAGELEMVHKPKSGEISYSFDTTPDEEHKPHFSTVSLILLNYLAVLLFALIKGGGGKNGATSILGIQPCSVAYWMVGISYMVFCVFSTCMAYRFAQLDWSYSNLACYSVIAFLGGIGSGMLGLGGGVIISPLMLDIGVSPQSTAASSSLMVLFTSSSTSLQFFLGNMLDLQYAATMFLISMLASMSGITIIGKIIKRYRRPSIIVFLLAGITAFSAILLPAYAYYMQNGDSIHSFC